MLQWLIFASTFPEKGPYRVDQVRTDPLGLILLFALQIGLAALIDLSVRRHWLTIQRISSVLLIFVICIFFTLSSWGVGDVTRQSYQLVQHPEIYGFREPLWTLLAPLVRYLPYRFSFVHGLVVACYAIAVLWLAKRYKSLSWAGWWVLMIVYSPLLRGFFQAGITRQALAAILLMPLMLRCAGGPRLSRLSTINFSVMASLCHSGFPLSVLVAVSPLLTIWNQLIKLPLHWLATLRNGSKPALGIIFATGFSLIIWITWNASAAYVKLTDYLVSQTYYSHFLLRPEVGRLLLAIIIAVVLACFMRKINIRQFIRLRLSKSMLYFLGALFLIQFSIKFAWFPQLTTRIQDAVGLYLMIVFLAFMAESMMQRLTIIPVVATLHYWFFDRLALSGTLPCGSNDEFLCVPDRLPWDIVYWN